MLVCIIGKTYTRFDVVIRPTQGFAVGGPRRKGKSKRIIFVRLLSLLSCIAFSYDCLVILPDMDVHIVDWWVPNDIEVSL